MARQRVSIVEKHIEKGAVALLAGVLVWVVMTYVVRSPNTTVLKGAPVEPARIDSYVQSTAEKVWQAVESASPEPGKIPDFASLQIELAAGPLHQPELGVGPQIPAGMPFGTPVPEVQGPGARGQVRLATLTAPDRPAVRAGRYSTYLPKANSTPLCQQLSDKDWDLMVFEKEKNVAWVTAAVRLDVDAQKKAFLANDYETSRLSVETMAVLLQRQRALTGGGWSDWEEVPAYKIHIMPDPPPLNLLEENGAAPTMAIEERKVFLEWLASVRECVVDLVRPQMPEARLGDPWAPPMCADLVRLYPEEGFTCPIVIAGDASRRLSPNKQAQIDLEHARRLLDQNRIEEAMELVQKVLGNRTLARPIRDEAGLLEAKIIERESELERAAILAEEQAEGQAAGGETEPQRREEIYLAHDLTAEPGGRYRYRAKLRAYNQYAMVPDRLMTPADATRVFLESDWSSPSDPVDVPLLARVFLAKADPDKGTARFDVYVWTLGEWVKDNVGAKIGERIGKKQKVQHYGLDLKIDVEFDTGLLLLDVLQETERTYMPVEPDAEGGYLVQDPKPTRAALCAGYDRRVIEFLEQADNDSAERREIQHELDNAKKRKVQQQRPGKP